MHCVAWRLGPSPGSSTTPGSSPGSFTTSGSYRTGQEDEEEQTATGSTQSAQKHPATNNNTINLASGTVGRALFLVCCGGLIWVEISDNAAVLVPAKHYKEVAKRLKSYVSEKADNRQDFKKTQSDNFKYVACYEYPSGKSTVIIAREKTDDVRVWSRSELGTGGDMTILLRKMLEAAKQPVPRCIKEKKIQ